ncbi:MAG: hypothetical protein QOI24_1566 [Acidobacteriota bacterium]|jgi:uncharacterized protein (DUF885 family)|nr:hypothetical protein [Acidobacteriota bacterium]
MRQLAIAATLALLAISSFAAEPSAADLDKRRKALADLLHEQWEYTLKVNPEFASILGDKRYNAESSDTSAAEVARETAVARRFLARVNAIGDSAFSDQEKINKALMAQNLRNAIESAEMKEWEMPVSQMGGIHLDSAQFPSLLSFTGSKDYDDYLTRLHAMPRQFNDTIAVMRSGMRDRLMPPQFLLGKVAGQAQDIAAQEPEKSPFAAPLQHFPDNMPAAERTRIRTAYLDTIRSEVLPSYAKFATFVRDEYAPKGRKDVGMWSLPDGVHRYAVRARRSTTTNLTPEEIHQIGLKEVARIESEMLAIATKLGFSDLKAFNAAADANPDLHPKTREEILDIYRKYENQMYAELPKLFGRLPKAKLEVVPIEAFREKAAAGADYQPGAADGSRPGRINVNTSDPQSRKTIFMESTAYHEGVPGHHMQLSIAQELTDLPQFRRQGGYTAYVEGWALYSERLGKEVGFYQNPYNDYGRLNDEMLRAIRLVVDTGLHAKKWTRDQVVQFFHDHSATDEVEVQSETDRYIVWPGQALGYKIGQLKITELRERARTKLGDRFDIREFHDEILGAGALPMNVLEKRIDDWIAAKLK